MSDEKHLFWGKLSTGAIGRIRQNQRKKVQVDVDHDNNDYR